MNDYKKISLVMKTLGDENRLMIVEMLAAGELCACKILEEFNISQSTLSYHMKILCDSGLVTSRRDGKWMHYSLVNKKFNEISSFLNSFSKS